MKREIITPLLLSFNEQANIERTLERLQWAQRIVVIDSFSDDETLEILKRFPQVDLFQREFDTHAQQWNFGVEKVSTPWVLAMDSDYYLSDEFLEELKRVVGAPSFSGYSAQFKYCVYGKPLRASILPPRCVLFQREKGTYIDDGHTQRLVLDGERTLMSSYIYHDDRKSLSRWIQNQDHYMRLEAEKIVNADPKDLEFADHLRRLKLIAPILMPFVCLILRRGVFDGWRGFYYALQRTLVEILLSIHLIEEDLRKDAD